MPQQTIQFDEPVQTVQFDTDETPKTKQPATPPPPTFWHDPKAFLQKRIGELEGEAQRQVNMYAGPEATQHNIIGKSAHAFASYLPETAAVFDKVALGMMDWKTAVAMLAQKVDPAAAGAYFATVGTQQAYEAAKHPEAGRYSPDNVQNFLLGLSTAAGGGAVADTPGAGRVVETVKKAPEVPARAADLVHKGAQIAAGVGPERTTGRLAEEYKADLEKAQTKQAEENAATEQANRETIEKHATKRRENFRKAEEQQAEHTATKQEIDERNQAAQEIQTRRGVLARNLQQGSRQLGEQIQALDKKTRAVGDAKYNAIRSKLQGDEGVPAHELGNEMKAAVDRNIKGSKESLRQVQDVLRRGEGEGTLNVNGREFTPETDPIAWERFVEEGLVGEGKPIKFSDLQGYSTELGEKLARGNLPGDVYQATKAVKEVIDRHKTEIADRNGVGDELREADAFWRKYMDAFYDKPSAVAKVRERVGKLDPEFYSEPFISGKSAQTGMGKLKALGDAAPELKAEFDKAAETASTLRQQNEEFKGLPKKAKVEAVPDKAPVEMGPNSPELKQPKKIKMPERPTAEDVRARKEQEIHYAAREIGRLSKYDAAIIAGSAIGPFFGRWETMLLDPALIAGRKAVGYAMERPKVVEWLSRPRPEDLAIIKKLPPEVKEEVGTNLKNFVSEEVAHGRKVSVNGDLRKTFGWGSTVGSAEGAASDTAHFQQAKQELGPNASFSEIAQRAQELKTRSGNGGGESELESIRRGSPGEPERIEALNRVPFEGRASSQMMAEEIAKQTVEGFSQMTKEQQADVIQQIAKQLENRPSGANSRLEILEKGKKIAAGED